MKALKKTSAFKRMALVVYSSESKINDKGTCGSKTNLDGLLCGGKTNKADICGSKTNGSSKGC